MKSDRRAPVAIIGGGFSGTMLAAQLARRGIGSVLVEGSGRAGRGVAYSTLEPLHLLNVRADNMSAWPEDAQHFARVFASHGGDPHGFAQRWQFGEYLGEVLDEAIATGFVKIVSARAVGAEIRAGGWHVELSDGSVVEPEALALAIGNQPPDRLRKSGPFGPRYVENPWGEEAGRAVAEAASLGGDVLIIGTGLTMIDLVLSLEAAGHAGPITALSRRGLIPRTHSELAPAPVELAQVPRGNVRMLARWLRRRSGQVGWRAAVDSLRPHAHELWQALPPSEQKRFLRHARPWWDVHRHRIAPEVAQRIKARIQAGRLEVHAGRVVGMEPAREGIEVATTRRGAAQVTTRHYSHVFNCTGPLGAIAETKDPLLRSMLDRGLIQPDHLGIGVAVDARSRAAGSDRLWALGPLTKGRYWEIIAVPDIRGQAAAVAEDIAMELNR